MKFLSPAALAAAFAGLSAFSPIAAVAGEPAPIAVYTPGAPAQPADLKVLGAVHGQICRKPWELPPTQAEAIAVIKDKARSLGADTLIDVRFDQHRPEIKSACWQRIAVAGSAAVTAPRPH